MSLPDEDVEFLDLYAQQHAMDNRSAAVRRAVALLRALELGDDYAAAWDEWDESEDARWSVTTADGPADTAVA